MADIIEELQLSEKSSSSSSLESSDSEDDDADPPQPEENEEVTEEVKETGSSSAGTDNPAPEDSGNPGSSGPEVVLEEKRFQGKRSHQ